MGIENAGSIVGTHLAFAQALHHVDHAADGNCGCAARIVRQLPAGSAWRERPG
jgi:hypothetical protein